MILWPRNVTAMYYTFMSGPDWHEHISRRMALFFPLEWQAADEKLTYPSISYNCIREHFKAFQAESVKTFNKLRSLHFICAALIVNLLSSKIRLFYCSLKLSAIAFFKPAAVHWELCCVQYILRGPLIIIFAPSSNLYQCLYWQSAIFVYAIFYLQNKDTCMPVPGEERR